MQVSEIFYSLQGEGPYLGQPSVFIRLGGCIEPYCPWCDTTYAWQDHAEFGIREILQRVGTYPCRNIVITGGEPFLQWEPGLRTLHEKLVQAGFNIVYETSGKAGIPYIHDARIILSPKNINGTWLIASEMLSRADFYKFIAGDSISLREIQHFIEKNALPKERVYIMPLGKTKSEQLEKMEMVFTFCRDLGYWMTPRLHILTFDDKRGV